jgi:hypothetical protein
MSDFRDIRVLITGGAGLTRTRGPEARRVLSRISLSVIGGVGTASSSMPFKVAPSIGASLT